MNINQPTVFASLLVAALAAAPALAQPVGAEPSGKVNPQSGASLTLPGMTGAKHVIAPTPAVDAILKANDKNGDGKLNADECPEPIRPAFPRLDVNHDGYLDTHELTAGLGLVDRTLMVPHGNPVIASVVHTVADDFVVDVYHNGVKVPDARRQLTGETFGATDETLDLNVHAGDWLVFNVVNNRLRWGGVSYFAVAGMRPGGGVGFVSDTTSGRWSYCDDPAKVKAFIADPGYLAGQNVRPSAGKWERGDARMNELTDGWKGASVWGESRNTWIKYVAPSAGSRINVTY